MYIILPWNKQYPHYKYSFPTPGPWTTLYVWFSGPVWHQNQGLKEHKIKNTKLFNSLRSSFSHAYSDNGNLVIWNSWEAWCLIGVKTKTIFLSSKWDSSGVRGQGIGPSVTVLWLWQSVEHSWLTNVVQTTHRGRDRAGRMWPCQEKCCAISTPDSGQQWQRHLY